MTYKIAIASSDGVQIDETFGSVTRFLIFTVDDETIERMEERICCTDIIEQSAVCENTVRCGNGNGCNHGIGSMKKVEQIGDCRCVVCQKIGFQVQKQLERKAICFFDVSCTVVL